VNNENVNKSVLISQGIKERSSIMNSKQELFGSKQQEKKELQGAIQRMKKDLIQTQKSLAAAKHSAKQSDEDVVKLNKLV